MNEIIYVKHLKYSVQDKPLNLLLLPPPPFRKHMTVIDSEDSQMEETGKSTSSGLKICEYLQSPDRQYDCCGGSKLEGWKDRKEVT